MKPPEITWAIKDGRLDEVEAEIIDHLDLTDEYSGQTLLELAALVADPAERYASVDRLIELGIDVPWASRGADGALNVLLGSNIQQLPGLLETVTTLLKAGADAGAVSRRGRIPTMELANLKFAEEDIVSIYDLWFARDDLNLRHKNKAKVDIEAMLEKLGYRPEMLVRVNAWLADHPA